MSPEHPVISLVLFVVVFVDSVEGVRPCSVLILVNEASLPAVPAVRMFVDTDDDVSVREQEFELRCPVLGEIEDVPHQTRMYSRFVQVFLDCSEMWFFVFPVVAKDEHGLNVGVEKVTALVNCSEDTLHFGGCERSIVDCFESRR